MNDENLKTLGNKIRVIRQIKGISQEALALKLNISQAADSKIESGKTTLSYERLEVILEELSISDKTMRDFNLNQILNQKTFRN